MKKISKKFTVPTTRMKIGDVIFSVTKNGKIMGNNPVARELVASLGSNWKRKARKVETTKTVTKNTAKTVRKSNKKASK